LHCSNDWKNHQSQVLEVDRWLAELDGNNLKAHRSFPASASKGTNLKMTRILIPDEMGVAGDSRRISGMQECCWGTYFVIVSDSFHLWHYLHVLGERKLAKSSNDSNLGTVNASPAQSSKVDGIVLYQQRLRNHAMEAIQVIKRTEHDLLWSGLLIPDQKGKNTPTALIEIRDLIVSRSFT